MIPIDYRYYVFVASIYLDFVAYILERALCFYDVGEEKKLKIDHWFQ